MKRLVSLSQLEERQHEEVTRLLHEAGIEARETRPSLIDLGALWVRDEDFPRAREILREQSQTFAAEARAAWERDWEAQFGASWWRWFLHQLRMNPLGVSLRVALLAAIVAVAIAWPIAYILRAIAR